MIVAIVVTFNPAENIQYLLDRTSEQVDEIVVVDNGSSDQVCIAKTTSSDKEIHYILNAENRGLSTALNQGIKKALELGALHLLLLDQDTSLGENMVAMLIRDEQELLAQGEKVGVVGPRLIDVQSGKHIPFVRSEGFHRVRSSCSQKAKSIADHVITSGSLININVIHDVGLMWEPLFVDYIDVEWCHRARSKGYKVYGSAVAEMQHDIGEKRHAIPFTSRQIPIHSAFRVFYLVRNLIWVSRLPYFTRFWGISEFFRIVAKISVEALFHNERFARIKALKSGLWHGMTNFPKDKMY